MTNILILGGGVSAKRFIESYIYDSNLNLTICSMNICHKSKGLSQTYRLELINYSDLNKDNINKYNIIIVSIPLIGKYNVIKTIIDYGYKGYFIIEKPFSSNVEESNEQIKLLTNNYFIVPYTRRYLNFKYEFKDNNKIKWHVVKTIPKDKILTESIPHIIDFIQYNIGSCNKIDDIKYKENILSFQYDNRTFEIIFNNENIFTINDEIMKDLDYIKANNIMLMELLAMNKEKQKLIIDDIKNNMICFERITEYERNN